MSADSLACGLRRGPGVRQQSFSLVIMLVTSLPGFAATGDQSSRLVNTIVRGQSDTIRPKSVYRTNVLGNPLTIGRESSAELRYRQDIDLDSRRDDKSGNAAVGQKFKILLEPSLDFAIYSEIGADYEADLYAENGNREQAFFLELDEQWILLDHIAGSQWSLQAGRQTISDAREWWWDEDLDALRVRYLGNRFRFEAALAEEINLNLGGDKNIEDQDIFRTILHLSYEWLPEQKFEGFYLYQNDHSNIDPLGQSIRVTQEDVTDATLSWYGFRFSGRKRVPGFGKFKYWLDTATVTGDEKVSRYDSDPADPLRSVVTGIDAQKVSGWAMDVGVSWRSKLPGRPRFTLGYAQGAGDNHPDDGIDHAYRPTGLEDNNGKFFGVDRFRYYGELLRPKLSNLRILTLANGYRLGKDQSLEIIYHRYQQEYANNDFLSRIKPEPNGTSRDIGEALDIVVGLLGWQQLEIEFVASAFRPGRAFSHPRNTAYQAGIEVNYNF